MGMFEIKNNNNKLIVNETIPCMQLLKTCKISAYDDWGSSSYKDNIRLTYKNIGGLVYFAGFNLNDLSDGKYCISTRPQGSPSESAFSINIYYPQNGYERVKNVSLYFFGAKDATLSTHHTGLEIYDSRSKHILFTSKSGTKYLDVKNFSTAKSATITLSSNPTIFCNMGYHANKQNSKYYCYYPFVTKSGNTVTVSHENAVGALFYSDYNFDTFSWMLADTYTVG